MELSFSDNFTFAAWLALDLHTSLKKSETHFLALTLRRKIDSNSPCTLYTFVDAEFLPLAPWDALWESRGTAAMTEGGQMRVQPSLILQQDRATRLRDGNLGSVLVVAVELGLSEEKPVERAVHEVSFTCSRRGY